MDSLPVDSVPHGPYKTAILVPSQGDAIKRLLFLLPIGFLPVFASFEEFSYEDAGLEWSTAEPSGCATATVGGIPTTLSSNIPVTNQTPAGQTREPDLIQR